LPAAAKLAVLVAVGGLVGTAAWLNSQGNAEQANTPTPDSQASQAVTPPRPAHAESVREHEAPPEPEASQVAAEAPEQPSSQVQKPAPKRAAKPSEASLLSQAQRALKSDPARALAITRQHKRLYPTGALSQEREVIAIEALSRLNKKGSAQQKADAFKEKYPESAHQKKIDTLKR
jgi:cytoskeletal protein RodZ